MGSIKNAFGSAPRRWRSCFVVLLAALASMLAAGCEPEPSSSSDEQPSCDDGDPCTADKREGATCSHAAAATGTPCSDGNACNGSETCDGHGICRAEKTPSVDDDNPCTKDACDPDTGFIHAPLPGVACTDDCGVSQVCNTEGGCGAGPLDDGNPCTIDSCAPKAGGVRANLPRGVLCDDGNVCNGIGVCNAEGECVAGPAAADGTSCSDGDICNGAETCAGGKCMGGKPPAAGTACDDGNPCTLQDTCDGSDACVGMLAADGVACDDGNPCTVQDDCGKGACTGNAVSGVACSDGDACNGAETCAAGVCTAGSLPVIDDGDPHTLDACDPATGQIRHSQCQVLDLTVANTIGDMVACLYSGPAPLQAGLTEIIDPLRAAAIHGKVMGAGGGPLAGVTVTLRKKTSGSGGGDASLVPVLAPAGYGSTLTRGDGAFDLALNGGPPLILDYSRPGYLPAQREIQPEAGRFVTAPDVVLKPRGAAVTVVELGGDSTELQTVRGSLTRDARGVRQVTLLFAPGTIATLVMPDGSTSALPAGAVHVYATEYTVGPDGPEAMPASLPPSSAYTYAVELSLDEATAAGARSADFDPPVIAYLENFVGFPAGENVPSGAYRSDLGLWEAGQSGRVVRVVGAKDGVAALDVDGDAAAEPAAALEAIGIDVEERRRIAELYAPGQSLWRIPVAHFSPWDWNWGWGPPAGAAYPNVAAQAGNPKDDPCTQKGSIIGCESRSLGEVFGVVGTPYSLHYESTRTPGYTVPVHVPATGDTLPPGTLAVKVEFDVAGQHQAVELPPKPNIDVDFVWDGRNAFGAPVQGPQAAQVSVGYEFARGYTGTGSFGASGGGICPGCIASNGSGSSSGSISSFFATAVNAEIMLWQRRRFALDHFNAVNLNLGGMTLDVHHVYDPAAAVLYLGNGEKRSGDSLVTISTFAGGGMSQADDIPARSAQLFNPYRIAQGPDGAFYVATYTNAAARLVKIDAQQVLTTVWPGEPGSEMRGLAVGPDGAIFFSDAFHHKVYRIAPGNATAQVIAGTGAGGGDCPDGTAATKCQLYWPHGVAVGPGGSVYIADAENSRILRVDSSGNIWRVAGSGVCHSWKTSAECGDGGPALKAALSAPTDIAIGPDGTIYFTDTSVGKVRAVTADGIIHRVAGRAGSNNQVNREVLSGVPAKSALLEYPQGLALSPDGALYVADTQNGVIRRIEPPLLTLQDEASDENGAIRTVAGSGGGALSFAGEGGLATAASLKGPLGVLATPDGTLYFTDPSAGRVFRVRPALPGQSLAKTAVVSEDGAQVFVFDESRRHEKTLDAMTGKVLFAFQYDAAHLLSKVSDAEGRETQVLRDAQGKTVTLVGPFGHATKMVLGADGYATSIAGPDGHAVKLGYKSAGSGLLASLADPKGNATSFTYDVNGRLISDKDPGGGSKVLSSGKDTPAEQSVSVTTALGRTTIYDADESDPEVAVREVTGTDGLTARTERVKLQAAAAGAPAPGQIKTTAPDGTTVTLDDAPDPRFGLAAPFAKTITTSSGGHTQIVTRTRTVMANPNDPTDISSLVDSSTVNGAATWTSAYEKLGNGGATWTRTSPLGRQGSVLLDDDGRVVQVNAPGVAPVVIEYSSSGPNKGRPWRVSQSSGAETRATEVTYEADGDVTDVISPLGETTHYDHDANGRVTYVLAPEGRTFDFQHDKNGNVTDVIPAGPGGNHHFDHDSRDLVSQYTPADVGPGDESTKSLYSLDGEPSETTLPDGSVIVPSFDGAGRLTSIASHSGVTELSYYPVKGGDPSSGKLSSVTSPDGIAQAFAYAGALTTDVIWTGPVSGALHYTYDDQFRVASEAIGNSPAVGRSWDLDGQAIEVGELQLAYDPATGFLQGTTLLDVSDSVTWSAFGELSSYSAATGAASLLERAYTRDAAGRVTHASEALLGGNAVETAYGYDLAGRLTDVSRGGVTIEHYAYDAHGNRTGTTNAGQPAITATFDAQDRVLAHGGATYTHVITGERLSRTSAGATTTYTYDTASQLKSVALPDGTLIEYLYDAAGRRVAKKVNGAFVQRFLYGDALGPAALVDESGDVLDRYVYGTSSAVPDYLVRMTGPQAGTYRLIQDERGSVRLVVNAATGAVAQQLAYDAYGRVLVDTSPGFTPFGFAGGIWDTDTGLVRFGLRDYDPETGRWTTQDPIGLAGGDTNLYAYVAGDPINAVDPTGLAVSTNAAMSSALGGGFLSWVGFEEFARGMQSYRDGVLELSNDGTFNQGIKDIRAGACHMVGGGITLATQTGPTAAAMAAIAPSIFWSATKKLGAAGNALAHWKKHGHEFPGMKNALQYAKSAQRFVTRPAANSLIKTRANGDVVIYHPPSNVFAVRLPSGAPKTMFRPDPAAHGYPTNMDYFNAQ